MPQNLTPGVAFPTTPLVCPKDGEPFSFASFITPVIQPLLDASCNPLQNPAGMTQSTAITKSGAAATTAQRIGTIAPGTGSQTLDVSKDIWFLDTPSTTITITLKSTSPVPPDSSTIEISCVALGTHVVHIQRESTVQLVSLDGGGSGFTAGTFKAGGVKAMFTGGSWRVVSAWGDATTASPAVP